MTDANVCCYKYLTDSDKERLNLRDGRYCVFLRISKWVNTEYILVHQIVVYIKKSYIHTQNDRKSVNKFHQQQEKIYHTLHGQSILLLKHI